MKDNKVFLDSNIIIYLHSGYESYKRELVENIVKQEVNFVISTQVIVEFSNVMTKKFKVCFEDLKKPVGELLSQFNLCIIQQSTLEYALEIANRYKYSYVDSLIIATAIEDECNFLFSEDMHNGQSIEGLKIVNPFLEIKM